MFKTTFLSTEFESQAFIQNVLLEQMPTYQRDLMFTLYLLQIQLSQEQAYHVMSKSQMLLSLMLTLQMKYV